MSYDLHLHTTDKNIYLGGVTGMVQVVLRFLFHYNCVIVVCKPFISSIKYDSTEDRPKVLITCSYTSSPVSCWSQLLKSAKRASFLILRFT